MEPINKKIRPNYNPVLFALMQFRNLRITNLSKITGFSRPFIMKILITPDIANGYERKKLSKALHITTRFLDDIITGNIKKETTFQELYILQENLKADATELEPADIRPVNEMFNDIANGRD